MVQPSATATANDPASCYWQLTQRQKEIWRMIATSHNTKDIAAALKISDKTVEFHRTGLKKALGVFDVAGLTRAAIKAGVIIV